MKTKRTSRTKGRAQRLWSGMAVLALLLTSLTACDSSSAVGGIEGIGGGGSLDETVTLLASDLGLSANETAALSASFAKFGDDDVSAMQEPGFLWHVAAELQATLTEEQKARLFERLEQAGQRRRGGPGMQQQGGPGGPGMSGQQGQRQGGIARLDLSDEQKEAIATIRQAYKPQIEAILAERENLTRAEIKEQLEALHESIRTEIEGVLTSEQVSQLEEWKAEAEARRAEREAAQEAAREEAKLVMIEVLGLTEAQVASLDDLRASAEAEREAIRELIESGADRDAVKSQVEAQREAHQEAMASILDDTQLEITMIHRVLSSRMQAHRQNRGQQGQGGPAGPGRRGPGGQGGPGGPGGQGGFGGSVNG
jgi:Spy/CpxP family protein refolding chaperone